jgi:hypothetical protein
LKLTLIRWWCDASTCRRLDAEAVYFPEVAVRRKIPDLPAALMQDASPIPEDHPGLPASLIIGL